MKLLEYLENKRAEYLKYESELGFIIKGTKALDNLLKAIANGQIEDI